MTFYVSHWCSHVDTEGGHQVDRLWGPGWWWNCRPRVASLQVSLHCSSTVLLYWTGLEERKVYSRVLATNRFEFLIPFQMCVPVAKCIREENYMCYVNFCKNGHLSFRNARAKVLNKLLYSIDDGWLQLVPRVHIPRPIVSYSHHVHLLSSYQQQNNPPPSVFPQLRFIIRLEVQVLYVCRSFSISFAPLQAYTMFTATSINIASMCARVYHSAQWCSQIRTCNQPRRLHLIGTFVVLTETEKSPRFPAILTAKLPNKCCYSSLQHARDLAGIPTWRNSVQYTWSLLLVTRFDEFHPINYISQNPENLFLLP